MGVGVRQSGDNFANFGLYEGVTAGASFAMVRARLEGDVGGGTFDRMALMGGILQGHDLCMVAAGSLGVALANNLSLRVNNDTAHPWIG